MPKTGRNIYRRKDGRWEGRIPKPSSRPGERKYRSVYGRTCQEVREKMETARVEMADRNQRLPCTVNMEEAVLIWLADKKNVWKASTYASYRQIAERYILPYFGSLYLRGIDRREMEGFVSYIQEKQGEHGISGNRLAQICGVVRRVISHMKKRGDSSLIIPEVPLARAKKIKSLFPDDRSLKILEGFLLENVDDETNLGILTALYTGMRIGEICALTWANIDLEANLIHVRENIQRIRDFENSQNKTKLVVQSPKTADSVRDIPIPSLLTAHLKAQKKQLSSPFLQGPKGGRMEPRTLQYRFKKILEKCKIPYFNFHMLRHAFATRCMEKGFDAKALSEILGHSDSRITLGLYTHPSLRQKERLMNLLGAYSEEEYAEDHAV